MRQFAWRVVRFTFAFLIISLLWLIFDVPYGIRYWFEDRWRFIADLWAESGASTPLVPGKAGR